MKTWHKLTYKTPEVYDDLIKQEHILIGGTTGSGKSTALHGIILTLLKQAPCEVQFVLIDPKGNELMDYEYLPHTIAYGYTTDGINRAIQKAERIREERFSEMRRNHQKQYNGSHIYVIIDEYAKVGGKIGCMDKKTKEALTNLAFLGRASNIHLIACTQRPTQDVIDGLIKNNFTTKLALRTNDAQESRNIISVAGCERFPKVGKAYYKSPSERDIELVDIHQVPQTLSQQVITHWINQAS